MSTAMNFGVKSFKAVPPARGSFPLDHDGECKEFKDIFMKCLRTNDFDNFKCRAETKKYLECRMEKDLMQKEDLTKLGFRDLESGSSNESEVGSNKR